MSQRATSDLDLIESAILAAVASMAAVDCPLGFDALLTDVDIDSLDLVELTQVLQDEFEVTVPANAFADVASVGDLIDVVKSRLA